MNYFANFGGQYLPQLHQPSFGGQMAPPRYLQSPGFGGNALAAIGNPAMQTGGQMPAQSMQAPQLGGQLPAQPMNSTGFGGNSPMLLAGSYSPRGRVMTPGIRPFQRMGV